MAGVTDKLAENVALDIDKMVMADGPPMIDIVFDGPPGPESGRFVEAESPQ